LIINGGFSKKNDSDDFISSAFFGGVSKCTDCHKKVQPDWKVCPYCEKRLVKQFENEELFGFRVSSTLISLCFLPNFALGKKSVWTASGKFLV
jgi:hypothetical protein